MSHFVWGSKPPLPVKYSLWDLESVSSSNTCHISLLCHMLSRNYYLHFSHAYYYYCYNIIIIISSFQEWANAVVRLPSSVRLSVCKLLRKSLLLADSWPDRHQTCTRLSIGKPASRVFSRSRSRSKVTWYTHFFGFLEWATPSLPVWLMSFICRKFKYVQQVRHVSCCMFMSSEMFSAVSETRVRAA